MKPPGHGIIYFLIIYIEEGEYGTLTILKRGIPVK